MKRLRFITTLAAFLLLAAFGTVSAADTDRIRVLVITGGHDFEREPFFKLFKDNPEITFQAAEHPSAHAWFKKDQAARYDVILAYDMHQDISDEAKKDFLALLSAGKGLVVMHHAIASYQKWPEYAKIIGAKYYLEDTVVDGVKKPRSLWQHDVKIKIQVADKDHPVTQGIDDFEIHDETYKLFDVFPDTHTLLTTREPLSNPVIAWSKSYGPARVVYLQGGHDHFAYENANFQKIVQQAIRWTAKR